MRTKKQQNGGAAMPSTDLNMENNSMTQTATQFNAKPAVQPTVKPVNSKYVWMNYPLGMVFQINGKNIAIRSSSATLRGKTEGRIPVGEFECTIITTDEWDALLKKWHNHPLFKKGLIYATTSDYDGRIEAANRASLRHGLEPVEVKQ